MNISEVKRDFRSDREARRTPREGFIVETTTFTKEELDAYNKLKKEHGLSGTQLFRLALPALPLIVAAAIAKSRMGKEPSSPKELNGRPKAKKSA